MTTTSPCPCGLGKSYGDCCGRVHLGTSAATAELLMRSRYSAFAVGDTAYLLRTWHPSTRPVMLELEPGTRWTRLEVLGTTGGGVLHQEGTVEFRAHYLEAGRPGELHENSRFRRENGLWTYLDALA
ncbi:MAG: YchJ family protein [Umezawaea sp.]